MLLCIADILCFCNLWCGNRKKFHPALYVGADKGLRKSSVHWFNERSVEVCYLSGRCHIGNCRNCSGIDSRNAYILYSRSYASYKCGLSYPSCASGTGCILWGFVFCNAGKLQGCNKYDTGSCHSWGVSH